MANGASMWYIFLRHKKTKNISKLGVASDYFTIIALDAATFSLPWGFILVWLLFI